MLDIGGRPLLDIWLDAFECAGVDEVLVNLHHLPDVVRRHLAARTGLPIVRTVFEPELLGQCLDSSSPTANGSLVRRHFSPAMPTTSRTLMCDRSPARHLEHDALATLTVFHSERPSAGGVVELDGTGRVVGFVEKPARPVSDLTNAGMYAFHPRVLYELSGPPPCDIGYDLLLSPGGPRPGDGGRWLLPRYWHSRRLQASTEGVARTGLTMIITQTPLRIGLLGGGTDLPGYYREHGRLGSQLRDR